MKIFFVLLIMVQTVCTATIPPSPIRPIYMPIHIVKKDLGFTIDTNDKYWIAQKQLYDQLQVDASMDTSIAIHTFRLMTNTVSRFKWLSEIENHIVMGDYTTANTLLSYPIDSFVNTSVDTITGVRIADTTAADLVVSNYVAYYKLLLKYQTNILSSDDSTLLIAIANKCPYIEGSIVFKARGLYNLVFTDVKQFNDLGCEGKACDSGSRKTSHTSSDISDGQQYLLYPNPNNGIISLQQLLPDDKPVWAEVLNVAGTSIYKEQIQFSNGNSKLFVSNRISGTYLLHLIDSKGRMFTLKFVIE